jgi:tryptophan synthase alpha chain
MLDTYLKRRRKDRDILLMTHIVMGYPSFDDSLKIVDAMVAAGVDLMELQIPFSEPIADGPVILRANQQALDQGATVRRCFDFAADVARRYKIPFLFMTYYNILFKYGVEAFVTDMATAGLHGAIVPDLPPKYGADYLTAMADRRLSPVFIFTPTTSDERMQYLASVGDGMIYCVARKGVTGSDTAFSDELQIYLSRCRQATDLPLALGFGVKDKADVDYLTGKVDIAVIGTKMIEIIDENGTAAVAPFIRSLR